MGRAANDDNPDGFSWFDRKATAWLRWLRFLPPPGVLAVPFVLAIVAFVIAQLARASPSISPLATAIMVTVAVVPTLFAFAALSRGLSISEAYTKAYEREDLGAITRLRRLMDGTAPPRTPFDRANRLVGDGELLLYFERWAEARDALIAIDHTALPFNAGPGVLSQEGLATAHAGQPEIGLAKAERAWRDAEALPDYPDDKMWFVRARLGIVLSLAGKHDDASEVLLEVLTTDGGDPRTWTAAQFFRASSLRASGDFEEAAAHLSAAATDGDGPYVARAKAAMELAAGAHLRLGVVMPEPASACAEVEDEEEAAAAPDGAESAHRLPRR